MKWSDTGEIALALTQKLPEIDPKLIRHTQLRVWVMELNHFSDDPDLCDENTLKAIQSEWITQAVKKGLSETT